MRSSSGIAYKLILLLFIVAILSFVVSDNFLLSDCNVVISAQESKKTPEQPNKSPGAEKSPAPKPSEELGTKSDNPSSSVSPTISTGSSHTDFPTASSPESASREETTIPGETAKKGFDFPQLMQQYKDYLVPIAGGIGALIVILIILVVLLRKKKKHVCESCRKQVLPGMVYCEDCSGQRVSKAEQERVVTSPVSVTPKSTPQTVAKEVPKLSKDEKTPEVPKVKPRPTGRVIAVLTVRRGANQGYRLNFYESLRQIAIGSDADCDMVIEEDDEVSARHAVITMTEDTSFLIHDMGNTSGLYVNSERVNKSGLKSGDVIRVGKTELTFARL